MAGTKNIEDLSQSLGSLLDRKLTGEVIIASDQTEVIVTLNDGKLLWVADKNYSLRRWQRAINKCCNDRDSLDLGSISRIDSYQQLAQAISTAVISIGLAKNTLSKVAEECFFELMVRSSSAEKATWEINQNNQLVPYPELAIDAEQTKTILLQATLLNQQWRAAELNNYSPTLFPVLKQSQKYDAMEVPLSKTNLQGNDAIWDIAAKTKIPLILLAQSLINLERQNVIVFQQLDLASTQNIQSKTSSPQPQSKEYDMVANNSAPNSGSNQANNPKSKQPTYDRSKPLIACIDDSPVLSHSVKKILTSVGYQALIIREPMQGMGLLVRHRPNLILLDLMMPTVNGYAVCRFLRETTLFKTTPIIILTSKDSIVDRTKAKLVGASDFLSKPPIAQDLLQIIRLHIIDIPLS